MQVITNTQIIESRSKWAKRLSPAAMLVLLGGFALNMYSFDKPEYTRYVFALLLIGFFLAIASSHLVNRWVKEPRSDQVLGTTLKKFGKEFVLFNYTTKPPHILITPTRVYAIVAKRQTGDITVNGAKFSRKFSWARFFRFFGEESMGLPEAEAENGKIKLAKLLKDNGLSDEEIPEIDAVIVFTNKEANVTINEPALPVLRGNELKSYLREHDKQHNISAQLRSQLIEIFGGVYATEEVAA
jgi:hypothetical protein